VCTAQGLDNACAVRVCYSNCRSEKTLSVTISHHCNSTSVRTTTTATMTAVEPDDAAYSGALLTDDDDDDDDEAVVIRPVGWCARFTAANRIQGCPKK